MIITNFDTFFDSFLFGLTAKEKLDFYFSII